MVTNISCLKPTRSVRAITSRRKEVRPQGIKAAQEPKSEKANQSKILSSMCNSVKSLPLKVGPRSSRHLQMQKIAGGLRIFRS